MIRNTCCALVASCFLGPNSTQAAEWEYALNQGSTRLLLFTLIKEEPRGADARVQQLLRNTGMIHKADTAQPISSTTYAQPLLSYDYNINGGIPSDTIQLGPFEFLIDEDSRAKSGFLLGGKVGHARKYSLDFGQTLSMGLSGSFEYSFKHEISKAVGSVFGCYEKYLKNWTFIDLCLSANVVNREKAKDRVISPSISLSKYFSTDLGSHEIKASFGGILHQDYSKPYLNISGTTVFPDFGAVSISLYASRPAEGFNTRKWGAGIGLGKSIFGKYSKLSANYFVEDGSSIFGSGRDDKVFSIEVERQLNKRAKIHLTAQTRSSTISAYSGEEFNVRFELQPWTK